MQTMLTIAMYYHVHYVYFLYHLLACSVYVAMVILSGQQLFKLMLFVLLVFNRLWAQERGLSSLAKKLIVLF